MLQSYAESKLELDQIDEVIVIGGASQIPWFQTGVRKVFDKKKICWEKNPDYAVALGLGMYASMLNKNAKSAIEEVLLKEHTTMNLGVGLKTKVADYVVLRGHDVLIHLQVHLVQIVEIDVYYLVMMHSTNQTSTSVGFRKWWKIKKQTEIWLVEIYSSDMISGKLITKQNYDWWKYIRAIWLVDN